MNRKWEELGAVRKDLVGGARAVHGTSPSFAGSVTMSAGGVGIDVAGSVASVRARTLSTSYTGSSNRS